MMIMEEVLLELVLAGAVTAEQIQPWLKSTESFIQVPSAIAVQLRDNKELKEGQEPLLLHPPLLQEAVLNNVRYLYLTVLLPSA